jgi:hypothetical protein
MKSVREVFVIYYDARITANAMPFCRNREKGVVRETCFW